MIVGFYEFMRAGHVKRWHVVNTTREQSIAEHSFLVTMIALELNKCFDEEGVVYDILPIVMGGLFHDISEVRYGDIPTPGKQFLKKVTNNPGIFSDIEAELLPEMPYAQVEVTGFAAQIIKMADIIEAAHWIRDNGAGTHAKIVADRAWIDVERLTFEYSQKTGVDWYAPVNKVLMSLGMPYVYKDVAITPP